MNQSEPLDPIAGAAPAKAYRPAIDLTLSA
jgi:hypothetical protein